jgi:hypothetical protein
MIVPSTNIPFHLGRATQQRAQYKRIWMAGFDLAESYPDIHSISAANHWIKTLVVLPPPHGRWPFFRSYSVQL